LKRQLLDQLAATHDFPVPPSMVEAEFNQIWQQLEHEATHEPDPEAARKEMESERDDYRAIAERRVRLGLLLSEIGQANSVEITNEEMNRLVMSAAQQYRPADREKFVQYVRSEPMAAAQLRAPLFEDKVVDYNFGNAEIAERKVARGELEASVEAEHVHGPHCNHDHDHDHGHAPKKAKAKKAGPAKAEAAPAKAKGGKAAEAKPAPAKAAKPKAEPASKKASGEAKPAAKKTKGK
jgi:trigger factor